MPPKKFPWPAVSAVVALLVVAASTIASFSVNGEKIRQLEKQQGSTDAALSLNTQEHKKLMELLSSIDKTVARLDTKLEYLPTPLSTARGRR